MSIAVSVVVIVYNIPREIPRTLFSLSADYQRNIDANDYEIIVVDNGSDPPVDSSIFKRLKGDFRLIRMDPASPSPAPAINRGLQEARGEVVGVMIDGARLVTPGLLHFARSGAKLYSRAVVATLGWYLGYDIQRTSIEAGYDQAQEDALLHSIEWPNDGYRLFEISTLDESSTDGWFSLLNESNALFLRREFWDLLGGFDEVFSAPGGGLVNLDTLRRALEMPLSQLVLLIGEATFHQLHGGIATNASPEQLTQRLGAWLQQYAEIRGRPFDIPRKEPTYLGTMPRAALLRMAGTLVHPLKSDSPLGSKLDRELWTLAPPQIPADPTAAALVDLAHDEFRAGRYAATAAVARLARRRFPDEPEPQRLLALVGPALVERLPPPSYRSAAFHTAVGRAYLQLGDGERARTEFETANALEPHKLEAEFGLATLNLPGENYLNWLTRFHEFLAPEFYVEIGVDEGRSIARARPPTCAIGVDPLPRLEYPLQTETHIFTETSDEFFAHDRLRRFLGNATVSLAFIDGDHSYAQSLFDFIHMEAYCGPRSVILLHDAIPLNEMSQERIRRTPFYTGDVWRLVVCLTHFRPDLDIFTIAAPWSGLTVITGLAPDRARAMESNYQFMLQTLRDIPYSSIKDNLPTALNVVPNDVPQIMQRLQNRLNLNRE